MLAIEGFETTSNRGTIAGIKVWSAVSFMPDYLFDHDLDGEQLLNLFVVVVDLDF